MKEETRGGILHWGRESEEEGAVEIGHLRDAIRKAFGGRAPRVLDPFAGGGAIPLEAIRLGCEAVAADLNPVAWFILRCTLHYPHRLAGQARALPEFALRDRRFAEGFLKARGITGKTALREELARVGHGDGEPVQVDSLRTDDDEAPASSADLAWHLRACGERVLDEVRRGLAARYPTYAEFEPVRRKGRRRTAARPPKLRYHPRPARLLVPDEHGHVSAASLNAEFDTFYLENDANPRWIAKPPVAWLGTRNVRCSGCRAEIPLLKTRWLCRKESKRVLLTLHPRKEDGRIDFGVEHGVPEGPGSAAPEAWREALPACLAPSISRLADRGCALATWQNDPEKIRNTFARFALPMVWDFAGSCPVADTTGGFIQAVEWVARVVEHTEAAAMAAPAPSLMRRSATAADLAGRLDLLARGGRAAAPTDEAAATAGGEDAAEQEREISGSEARLKPWNRRRARDLGEPSPDGSPSPLIDCVHKLMQLWKTGRQSRVDGYLEARGLRRHELFARVVQALIGLAEGGSEERTTLESIQNHIGARGGVPAPRQAEFQIGESL